MGLFDISSEKYDRLMEQSLSIHGNGSRLKHAISKAQTENVNIAFLGGSVTMGYEDGGIIEESYPKQLCKLFSEQYGKDGTCQCINAGLSSANSCLGLALAEDKIRLQQPDIIVVEYAINNAMDKHSIHTFESLIYKLLTFESYPAVIVLVVCNQDYYSCKGYMEMIARHYDLPLVNIGDILKSAIEEGIYEWRDYSGDYGHPSPDGHKLIAERLMKLLEYHKQGEAAAYILPDKACYSREISTLLYVDHNDLIPLDPGMFEPYNRNAVFPNGWSHIVNASKDPLRFSLFCKDLFILYEQSNSMNYGEIEIYVDGTLSSSVDSYSIYGWNNPCITLVFQNDQLKEHFVEIKMRKGDESKEFYILGFGIV